MGQQDYMEAAQAYTTALEENPNDKVVYANRSTAWAKLKYNTNALKDAESAIDLDPSYAKAH